MKLIIPPLNLLNFAYIPTINPIAGLELCDDDSDGSAQNGFLQNIEVVENGILEPSAEVPGLNLFVPKTFATALPMAEMELV